jgi:(2R)-sulfolactate sulfo-lyase subunit beta
MEMSPLLVIGIKPKWTERVAAGIAKSGKPVASFSIEGKGGTVIADAARVAQIFLQDASEITREPASEGDLISVD